MHRQVSRSGLLLPQVLTALACAVWYCAAAHTQAEQVNVADASHGTAAVTIAQWIADNPPEPP
jgi:hypothetical protein